MTIKPSTFFPLALLAGFTTLFSSTVISAEITMTSRDSLSLTGPIQKGDAKRIELAISRAESMDSHNSWRTIALNSPGGDVAEAFSIGRLIRKHELTTAVPNDASCLSSCVFVLAAGVMKLRFGLVGIHRPYFAEMPTGNVDTGIKQLLAASENYLDEMNIPRSLAEEMFSTPPSNIRYLTNEEIERNRLDQPDIGYQEKEDLARAKGLGLTRMEYMRRVKLAEAQEEKCFKQHPDVGVPYIECVMSGRRKLGLVR